MLKHSIWPLICGHWRGKAQCGPRVFIPLHFAHLLLYYRALKNNTYFTSLIIHALPRKDAISELVAVLETNRALIALRFSAMQSGYGLERLGPLLSANPASRLSSLTLSDTPLSSDAAKSLSACAGRLSHLVLARCSLGDRELSTILPSLDGNRLKLLNLSGNRFDIPSSNALAVTVGSCKLLETLLLVSCSLRVEALFDPKNVALPALANLIVFDVSGNSMKTFGGQSALQLVSCGLSFSFFSQMLTQRS